MRESGKMFVLSCRSIRHSHAGASKPKTKQKMFHGLFFSDYFKVIVYVKNLQKLGQQKWRPIEMESE